MGNKLLLADDSITIQKVVGIIFANEDYELTIVDNGIAALEKATALRPDVMLVDALMPGKSGYEVCEAVRRDVALKDTPILLLTGAFEPFDEDKARQSGADDFISKPFESQHLIDKVKALLALGQQRASAPPGAAAPADIWADMSEAAPVSFDTSAAIEPAATEFSDAFSFEEVHIDETPVVSEVVAIGETAADVGDDLWGAFELEEVPAGEDAEVTTVLEAEEVASASAGVTEIDPFSFEDLNQPQPEAAPVMTAVGAAEVPSFTFDDFEEPQPPAAVAPTVAAVSPESKWLPVGEETFSFDDEPAAGGAAPAAVEVPFAFEEEEPAPAAAPEPFTLAEPTDFGVEFEAESSAFATELGVAPPVEPVVPPPSSGTSAAAVAPAGEMTISEEQLTTLVAKISRDIIEKIAWEVVPDVAEALIREEIRKIKEGR
ncbi:MAG TPA: response regulator [Geobacteraceae bacterium]